MKSSGSGLRSRARRLSTGRVTWLLSCCFARSISGNRPRCANWKRCPGGWGSPRTMPWPESIPQLYYSQQDVSICIDMALRKSAGPKPQIAQITPPAAIAGGELQIRGKGFAQSDRPRVTIGEIGAPVIIGSDSFVIARVPEGATAGELVIESGEQASESWACDIGVLVADSLHPVANPVIDAFG